MATNTYVALDKKTVTSPVVSVEFTSIPSTYTDLVLVVNGKDSSGGVAALQLRFNGVSETGYSRVSLTGDGSSTSSDSNTSAAQMAGGLTSGTVYNTNIIQIMNYSNANTHKIALFRGNVSDALVRLSFGLWRSTAIITSVTVISGNATFESGSTFSLYGIRAEGASPTVKATGGAVYSDDTYYYHVFGASGTFTPTQSITADYLVVAGGGGGGATNFGGYGVGAGGGAGGVKAATVQSLSASGYTVTVGSGGAGGSGGTSGGTGTSSSISGSGITTLTATGGVGPGQTYSGGASGADPSNAGGSGGTTSSSSSETYAAGGGGGSGSVGGSWNSVRISGNGGNGTSSYSSWVIATGVGQVVSGTGYIAGGGGGGYGRRTTSAAAGSSGTGGFGGGGNGTNANNATGIAGLNNTGSGGGGAGTIDAGSPTSGKGGSGVVIVRYAK